MGQNKRQSRGAGGRFVLQPWQQGGRREKHRKKVSVEEKNRPFRMPQTILATSSDHMLGVACASPRTAPLSSRLRIPPSTLPLLSHRSLPNPTKEERTFLQVREWDRGSQGQSKTSVSHGRGEQSEAQDAGRWLFRSAQHSGTWGRRSRLGDSRSSLPAAHTISHPPISQLERLQIAGSFWSPLAELSSSGAV